MDEIWTPHRAAEELLNFFNQFRRLMGPHMKSAEDNEATFMQVRALFFLLEKPITASELARKRHVSLQSASVLVQGWVEKGWVKRTPNPNDRRQFLLEVTPEGMAQANAAKQEIADKMANFLEGLTQEELAAAQILLPGLHRLMMKRLEASDIEHDKEQP